MSENINELIPMAVPPEFRKDYCNVLQIALKYGVLVESDKWDLVQPKHYVVVLSGAGYHIKQGIVVAWKFERDRKDLKNPDDGDIKIDYVLEENDVMIRGSLFPHASWYARDDRVVVVTILDKIRSLRTELGSYFSARR